MINAEYGKPALVRFSNHLDENPLNLARQDFGRPGAAVPHPPAQRAHRTGVATATRTTRSCSARRTTASRSSPFVDQLYLNWPAGNDDREKQTFFWYHDHVMDFTAANVYKGMVGLYPLYDPKDNLDAGDETQGLRCPGVRTNHADGSFDVDFDIPLAIYDVRLDDGVTIHKDFHDGQGEFPEAGNPRTHPEWWGKIVLQALPQPRLRRRHLHRQRHRVPGAGGQAAQVPVPVPGLLGLPDLRVPADDLDERAESRPRPRLHQRGRTAGPVPASRTASRP